MALAQASASLSPFFNEACRIGTTRGIAISRIPVRNLAGNCSAFASGLPLLSVNRRTSGVAKHASKSASISIRCEQDTQEGNGLDVWLGRGAMVGFAVAITVEKATGKGLLENFGLASPLPTVVLAVTGLVGVLTAVFIFQSASKN